MSRDENPPFGRGETYFNGGTVDSTSGAHLEGMEWVFKDRNFNTYPVSDRTGRYIRCRCVRNTSGIALLPRRLVTFEVTAGADYGNQVDGYGRTTAVRAYPVDEFLPAAGVPANDLFWIVLEGPAECLTDIAAAAGNVINVGDPVVALTAATSQATTAGRVAVIDYTGATQNLALQVHNFVGRALSAKTTNNTAATILVDVGKY